MNVAVVYETGYGNTQVIATAVAAGLGQAGSARVELLSVAEASPDRIAQADLLVLGAPTHMRGLSRIASRRKVAESGAAGTAGRDSAVGVREWLDRLPPATAGRSAAAFDTRLPSRLAGGAARSISRGLRRKGYSLVAKPEGFIVDAAEGPLRAGEQDRATAWGTALLGSARQTSR